MLSDRIAAIGRVQKASGLCYHFGATGLLLEQYSSSAMPASMGKNICRSRVLKMGQNRTTGYIVKRRGKTVACAEHRKNEVSVLIRSVNGLAMSETFSPANRVTLCRYPKMSAIHIADVMDALR